MTKLPKPDGITLSESANRVARAFGAELSAVEAALIDAFHNRKIRTRGRFRPYFGNNRLHDLPYFFWDRAKVHWQINKFVIPSGQLDPMIKMYLVGDVEVCREDMEKWINSAMPDLQQAAHEAAENLAPQPSDKGEEPRRNRKRDVEVDAKLRNRIERVLAKARRKWPKLEKRPGHKTMAKELAEKYGEELGYKFSAIHQILAGTYPALKRLGIGRL